MFYRENFSFYDGNLFTDYSLQGRDFSPPVWPSVGRFFPLHLQEFNLLRFITRTPAGYHTFAVAQLIIVLLALFVLLREDRIVHRVPILIGALLAPSFVVSFTGLIFAERNILLWLAIMLLCLHRYSKSRAVPYCVGCLVATHFVLYYKEIIVVFIVTYAASRIFLDTLTRWRTGQGSWQELVRANPLQIGMLSISAIYGALFLAAMFPFKSFTYVATHQVGRWSAILGYLRIDWLLFVLIPVLGIRLMRFLFAEGQLDLLWDPLALAALAYFSCLIALRLFSSNYTAPADLVALLYLAQLSLTWLSNPTPLRVSVVTAALICLLTSNAVYSSFRVIESKGVMSINGRLGEFLRNYRPADGARTVELFFPYADGYRMEELSAYLRSIGLNLVGKTTRGSEAGPRFLFEGREAFADRRCVGFKDYACIHADSAGEGALIIALPDDAASNRNVEDLGKDSVLLMSMTPCNFCTRAGSWFRSLYAISGYFWEGGLPEHWLQLHVFEKTRAAHP